MRITLRVFAVPIKPCKASSLVDIHLTRSSMRW